MPSKLTLHLKPTAPADLACYSIYRQLLAIMQNNEQDVIAATNSKCLHDFRVAVRKTRSGLSQFKGVLPEDIQARYVDFFAWLGAVTTPVRDLDVQIEHFADCPMQADLQPLRDFLHIKRQQAHSELVTALQSTRYSNTMTEWQQYLKEPVRHETSVSIKALANQRLRKNYQNVLRQGKAITHQSADTDLHELRKSCKKLRYLIEFFQSLYSKGELKPLLSNLKALQNVLGDFQDCTVQEEKLNLFRSELSTQTAPANTVLALSALIEKLHARKAKARHEFAATFMAFKQTKKPNFSKE